MNPEPYNFIVAKFGDNDYGWRIKTALEEGVFDYNLEKKACPIIWKNFITAFIVGETVKRDAASSIDRRSGGINYDEMKRAESYMSGLRITFEKKAPTDDDDGGSAAFDINRMMAWTF